MVWFDPQSKTYFESESRFYGHTKGGGYTCRTVAKKSGFRTDKGNWLEPPPASGAEAFPLPKPPGERSVSSSRRRR